MGGEGEGVGTCSAVGLYVHASVCLFSRVPRPWGLSGVVPWVDWMARCWA